MENLAIMDMFESKCHLDEPGEYLMFGEEDSELFLFGDFVEHISALTVIHDDAETPTLGRVYIFSMKDYL